MITRKLVHRFVLSACANIKTVMVALPANKKLNRWESMDEVKDLTPLYKKYKGQWVALKADEVSVISHGNKASDVRNEAAKKGFSKVILFKVPTKLLSYVG